MNSERLSAVQHQRAQQKAVCFRQQVERESQGRGFAEVFRLAALRIEEDVDGFCDRAQEVFEEIEAFGQEPQIDEGWLKEITGETDNFYFSTESLTQEAPKLPGWRGRKKKAQVDEQVVVAAVKEAVQSLEDALNVSHSEDVQSWIKKVATSLQSVQEQDNGISFWQLQEITELQPTALWLALLLGGQHWSLEQTENEFYKDVIIKAGMIKS
ncbi:MAG: hypothetical protein HLUCCA11_24110 [Phormidesmis priestleyi Ana]|uniref:Uncharacterized protein n=1 Tax=Phormidesmis priestleyi Ana TaxID=1666911 RepID=A0A0P7Z8X4_9CYAN|nr:MAG: hypothetical protein HLUCCA11_24110 [Phormidesmis priestleyi Ana]